MDKLEQFELFLLRRGKSSETVAKHIRNLKTVWANVHSFDPDKIDSFILLYLKKGRSKEYLNIIIQAARAWGEFLEDERYKKIKYFTVNPEESHKATLSDKEIEAFLALPPIENKNPTRASNKELYHSFTLYFKILAYTGMRPGEVAQLRTEAVDFGRNVFDLAKTKTHIPRLIPIPPIILGDLQEYIKTINRDILFINEKGEQVQKVNWRHQFESRLKRLGIKRQNLSTHSFRHSFITRFLEEDVNIFKVQRIVGHRKIETTNKYTHLVTKDLQTTIKKDRLARESLSYDDRFRQFREGVKRLLEDLANTLDEENKMMDDLTGKDK